MCFAERSDVAYNLLAVDFLPPSVIRSSLCTISTHLASGTITPLRRITHTLGNVATAFRQMIQATHVGKVVAAPSLTAPPPAVPPQSYPKVAITGGSGGLGVMMSLWLVQNNGPLYVQLLSRSGRLTTGATETTSLSITAASITLEMADTSMTVDVVSAFRSQKGPMLSAVMHASGVLQDSLLGNQSAASFKSVFAPKIGTLSALTSSCNMLPLAAITLFSSVSSLLGGAGQANYAAANSALDSLAHHWQAAGGVARSVQWGAWASSGMASEAVLKRLHRIGQGVITAEQGLLALGTVLKSTKATAMPSMPQLAVNDFAWQTYLKNGVPDFFTEFAAYAQGRIDSLCINHELPQKIVT